MKGEGKRVENYRGVALIPMTYKVYAEMIMKKLKEGVKGSGVIPHN